MSDVARKGPSNAPDVTALRASASLVDLSSGPVAPAPQACGADIGLNTLACSIEAGLCVEPPAHSCKMNLKLAFFFDGTGNNRRADMPTDEHSNVARLFNAHEDSNKNIGLFKFYIPGLGTYFPEIGDPGEDKGLAFGAGGEGRLKWAMESLDQTIKQYTPDQVASIRVALFGFSRGSALARAFAHRLAERCRQADGGWRLTPRNHSIALYFMGLFDSVASVGAPASTSIPSGRIALNPAKLDEGLNSRREHSSMGLRAIAFGDAPGADPTPGIFDGHMSWGGQLRLPAMVERCVHLLATQEVRNSFPLDTIWDGATMPPGAVEYVYPGVHSDVGGGYRPGEGGKSVIDGYLLSLIPLRHLYDQALAAGVPLLALSSAKVKQDFECSPELIRRYNKILDTVGASHADLGSAVRAHMRLHYAWRFHKIRRRLAAESDSERAEIARQEAIFRREGEGDPNAMSEDERKGLRKRVQELDAARQRADKEAAAKNDAWQTTAENNPGADDTAARQAYAAAKQRADEANAHYLELKARLDTLPGYDGALSKNLDTYDRHLLADVRRLKELMQESPRAKLRPHYCNLLDAHADEFERDQGLKDKEIIEFFDYFVHDSLAGFAKDATLPSDPRALYIGGDDELKYADNTPVRFREPRSKGVGLA